MLKIPLNFTHYQQQGALARDEDMAISIISNLRMLLSTPPGECKFLPTYGNTLYEAGREGNVDVWGGKLAALIGHWEPRLTNISVMFGKENNGPQDPEAPIGNYRQVFIRGAIDGMRPFEQVFDLKTFTEEDHEQEPFF